MRSGKYDTRTPVSLSFEIFSVFIQRTSFRPGTRARQYPCRRFSNPLHKIFPFFQEGYYHLEHVRLVPEQQMCHILPLPGRT